MPAPHDSQDDSVVEGIVVDGPGLADQTSRPTSASSARTSAPAVVDSWSSVAPKHATRTMTMVALAPLLILPLVMLATRLPGPVRPLLVILALVLTGYSYYKLRKPVRRSYQVATNGVALVNQDGETVRLPYDSMSDLAIELSGEGAGSTALVFRPRGPLEAGSRASKRPDGTVRVGFPQQDAARMDAAIRAADAVGYRGILRG